VCVVLISSTRGVFIGVQGGVTNLVKLKTHQVVADWPSHGVQPRPTFSLGFPSTASWRVSPQSQHARGCKVGLAGHPLGPLVSGPCTLPPHVRYTPGVTLLLVEFQISLKFLEMLQFGTYFPEIKKH
jgi:hypothetical protein